MSFSKCKYCLLLFAFVSFCARAQLVSPDKVRSLTVDDGLPQGFITGVVQDSKGFIWISTHDGLTRYDGRNMKTFRHNITDSASLSSNVIDHLAIDQADNLWIQYANREADVFDPSTGHCRHISSEQNFSWLNPALLSEPFCISSDDRKTSFILYFDQKARKGRLKYFRLDDRKVNEINFPGNEFPVYIANGKRSDLWVCTGKALYLRDDNERLKRICTLADGLQVQTALDKLPLGDIQVIKNDRLAISNGHDSWIYGVSDGRWQKIPIPASLSGHTNHFAIAPDNTLYLNNGSGTFRLNNDLTLTPVWIDDTKSNYWVPLIDHSNVLWVATNTFGLRLIDLNKSGFRSGKYDRTSFFDLLAISAAEGKNAEKTQTMAYDGRSCYDRNGELWLINLPYKKIDDHPVNNFSFIRVSNGRADIRMFSPAGVMGRNVTAFTFDDKNHCWACVDNGYLAEADLDKRQFSNPLKILLPGQPANYMLCTNGNLCVVYDDALQFFNPETKRSTIYKNQPGVKLFNDNYLLMAVADPHNADILWLATRGTGLIKFNRSTGQAKAITEKEGLPNNTVYAIIPDKHGFLWCSSNKGLFRFNPVNNNVVSFTRKDGLQGNEFNRFQFLALPNGRFAFGGTEGWTMFYPDSVNVDRYAPKVEITDIQINNNDLEQYSSWKNITASAVDSLLLDYDMNFVTFRFTGMQYNAPEKLRYRYQLTGVDKKWVNAGNQNTANYSGLPPGDYVFKMNSSNTAGIWSNFVRTIYIKIAPPWWKTWWAYSWYTIIAVLLTLLFFRLRFNQLRAKQEIILKQKESEQLRAVDEIKTRFFSNITHEFRTPLSLIISPVEQMEQDEELSPAVHKKLSSVRRNAKQLLRLINQLLDISKLESNQMKVSLSRGNFPAFIGESVETFQPAADAKQIDLKFDEQDFFGEYLFDEDKWEKIVYNLVSNAVKFTPKNGAISTSISATETDDDGCTVHLQVSDNGIGMSEESQAFIFNRFYQADDSQTRQYGGTGIGLALVKELTGLMNGSVDVTSVPGEGTIFDLYIPIKKAKGEAVPEVIRHVVSPQQDDYEAVAFPTISNNHVPLILVVEDNAELCAFIAESLQQKYRTLTASDGVEGIRLISQELPDIVISDVMMPGMTGFELCRDIKTNTATNHIALILLTAKAAHESVIEGLAAGADDYLTKPFYVDELLLRINNILLRQEQLRAYFQAQLTNPAVDLQEAEIPNEFISRLYSTIETRLDDPALDVALLAAEVAVSPRTLNRKLASLAGLSAGELIRQYRLKRSVEFLKAGCNVSETAYSVGFETHSHFSTSFKAFFGATPSEYLK